MYKYFDMRTLDLLIFIGYFIGTILFGVSFYKKSKSSGSFTLGNKNIPTWVLSMSIFATFVSSISYLAIPGQAYLSNWNAYVFCFTIPLALIVTNT